MSWLSRSLGDSVSSLTGQLSNLTKDILSEGTEEVSDHATELTLAKEQILSLESALAALRVENERLKSANRDLEEKAESSELQINSISREYRSLLADKEKEITRLKEQHRELLEHHAKEAFHVPQDTTSTAQTTAVNNFEGEGFDGWANESWGEFDDSLRLQREINALRQEVTRLKADSQHWRSVAGQLSEQDGFDERLQSAQHEILDLQAKVKELERRAAESREQAQHEVASLQALHQTKMAALMKRHKEEVTQLKTKLSSLEQQLTDGAARDRGSNSGLPESERQESELEHSLRVQLQAATEEQDKVHAALEQLEGQLEQVQSELQTSQMECEDQKVKVRQLQSRLEEEQQSHHLQLDALKGQLQDSERWLVDVEQSRQQESDLKMSIAETGTQLQQASTETDDLVERLASQESEQHAASLMDSLERDNLELREKNLKLQEQLTLLEKRLVTQQGEWQRAQETITRLKKEVNIYKASDSDNTLEQSLTSEVPSSKTATTAGSTEPEEGGASDWQVEREVIEKVLEKLRQEVKEKETKIAVLSTSGQQGEQDNEELVSLRSENRRLEEKLAETQSQRDELETSISELDEQNQQATDQLIASRNDLQKQLLQSQKELKGLQEELHNLSQQQPSAPRPDSAPGEEVEGLRRELEASRGEVVRLQQQSQAREEDMAQLKARLQKGTMALNDLHMDKQDLEEQLAKAREEVKAKVAAIRTLREEKAELAAESRELQQRLHDLEEELESWEQRNEASHMHSRNVEDGEKLRTELDELKKENSAQSQKLGTMFEELTESRQLTNKLQRELDDRGERSSLRSESKFRLMENERDRALAEREKTVRDGESAKLERDTLIGEKDKLLMELEEAIEERDKLRTETNTVIKERDCAFAEKGKAFEDRELAIQERDAVVQDLQEALSKQVNAQQEMDLIRKERDSLDQKLGKALDTVTQLEMKIASSHLSSSSSSSSQEEVSMKESMRSLQTSWPAGTEDSSILNSKLSELQEQVELLQAEKATLELELKQVQLATAASPVDSRAVHVHMSEMPGVDTAVAALQAENQRQSELLREQEEASCKLQQARQDLEQDCVASRQNAHSLAQQVASLETLVAEKDGEMERLNQDVRHLTSECDRSRERLSDSEDKMESLALQLEDAESAFTRLQEELEKAQENLKLSADRYSAYMELQGQLGTARDTIRRLEEELSEKDEMVVSQRSGIADLNLRVVEKTRSLETLQAKHSEQENAVAFLRQNSVSLQEEIGVLKAELKEAFKLLTPDQRSRILETARDGGSLLPASPHSDLPALEYYPKPALERTDTKGDSEERREQVQNGEREGSAGDGEKHATDSQLSEKHSLLPEQHRALAAEHAAVLQTLEEKEVVIAELQRSNASLMRTLESKALAGQQQQHFGEKGGSLQIEISRLQAEVRALKTEKEQMMDVLNEKSREASSLKQEVMRLMSVVSAERTAIEKLQQDNQELIQASSVSPSARDDSLEMTREAMQNLSHMVRDKEEEILALRQKNKTLTAVLQDINRDGDGTWQDRAASTLVAQQDDVDNLQRQLSMLRAEREQLVTLVNQKHGESVAYHAEIQRLVALRGEESQRLEQLQTDYDTLRPQFEDKVQLLLKAQNDLINIRQKYSELEIRYGELVQRLNASETVDAESYRQLEAEKQRVEGRLLEVQQTAGGQEERLKALVDRLGEAERNLYSKEAESCALKKQVDSLHFQLRGLGQEASELKQEQADTEHWRQEQQAQTRTLKDLNNQLTLAVRTKEQEGAGLQERVQQLTTLLSQQQGEKTQVAQLLRDQEAAASVASRLQQEVSQLTLSLKQRQQQLNDLQADNLRLKEKEQKLSRELERLRGHLLQMEEGYTREALEAEAREKTLRNRLAQVEEELASTTSRVQSASQQKTQQVESLQQQLHSLATQRDTAYMKVAGLEDQCQQYYASVLNLQLVLEQFQNEKDTLVAAETEHLQEETRRLKEKMEKLCSELEQTKAQLGEATEGLEAASRLSEQLDLQAELVQRLREEVEKREEELHKAEAEITKLMSSKEAKVDRELMKNLLLGYLHTPDRNRLDAIHAIGSVLGFTQHDFQKIEESHGGGWISSIFRRSSPHVVGATPPSTPVHRGPGSTPNQSFSQLFVKFLEVESTPPPAPVRLPAEEMAREVQEHHYHHHLPQKATLTGLGPSRAAPPFNPFTAPRHVAMPISVGPAALASSSSASHLLIAPPGSPTTAFPVFAHFTGDEHRGPGPSSSAILKDVLGSR